MGRCGAVVECTPSMCRTLGDAAHLACVGPWIPAPVQQASYSVPPKTKECRYGNGVYTYNTSTPWTEARVQGQPGLQNETLLKANK